MREKAFAAAGFNRKKQQQKLDLPGLREGKCVLPVQVLLRRHKISCPAYAPFPSTALNVLGFLFPIVGLILFLVYNEKAPTKAKAIGKWALIGFVVGLVCNILLMSL